MTHSVRFSDDAQSDLFDIGSWIEISALKFQLSSLRAKRGNPYTSAANGLPRRCAPRKDELHSGTRTSAAKEEQDTDAAFGVQNE